MRLDTSEASDSLLAFLPSLKWSAVRARQAVSHHLHGITDFSAFSALVGLDTLTGRTDLAQQPAIMAATQI